MSHIEKARIYFFSPRHGPAVRVLRFHCLIGRAVFHASCQIRSAITGLSIAGYVRCVSLDVSLQA